MDGQVAKLLLYFCLDFHHRWNWINRKSGVVESESGVADPLIRSAGVADPVNGRADPVQDGEREREVG